MLIYQKGDLKSQSDRLKKLLSIKFMNLIADSSSVDNVVKSSNAAIEGHPYSLGCEVAGNPVPSVSWTKVSNDEHHVGKILNFTNISRNDAESYTCEASNRCGNDSKTESISQRDL